MIFFLINYKIIINEFTLTTKKHISLKQHAKPIKNLRLYRIFHKALINYYNYNNIYFF